MRLTHSQYRKYVEAAVAKAVKAGRKYAAVFGIPRGGHYPAAIAAEMLGVPQIFDPAKITRKTLIVDDIADSGETMRKWKSGKGSDFLAVVRNRKSVSPDFFGVDNSARGDWVIFPDEHDEGVEEHLKRVLQYIGEDTAREGLVETPRRMRRAYDEIFSGYRTDPKSLVKCFTKGSCKEMVILREAEFYSTCEHHFFPFFGHCSIGYIPDGKVIGVSKLARLLDCFSKRMQIQERMTAQIADFLMEELHPKGVFVVCEGVHFCMTSRGVRKQDASMITSAIRGVFEEDAQTRNEFLHLIGR